MEKKKYSLKIKIIINSNSMTTLFFPHKPCIAILISGTEISEIYVYKLYKSLRVALLYRHNHSKIKIR